MHKTKLITVGSFYLFMTFMGCCFASEDRVFYPRSPEISGLPIGESIGVLVEVKNDYSIYQGAYIGRGTSRNANFKWNQEYLMMQVIGNVFSKAGYRLFDLKNAGFKYEDLDDIVTVGEVNAEKSESIYENNKYKSVSGYVLNKNSSEVINRLKERYRINALLVIKQKSVPVVCAEYGCNFQDFSQFRHEKTMLGDVYSVILPYKWDLYYLTEPALLGPGNDLSVLSQSFYRVHYELKKEDGDSYEKGMVNLVGINATRAIGLLNKSVSLSDFTYDEKYNTLFKDTATYEDTRTADKKPENDIKSRQYGEAVVPQKLRELKKLHDEMVLTDDEYKEAKKKLLDGF